MGRMSHPKSPSPRMSHFLAQPDGNSVAVHRALDDVREFSLWVHQIDVRTMRDEIAVSIAIRLLLFDVQVEFPDHGIDPILGPGQTEDSGIERFQVVRHDLTGIPLRINRDEKRLELA